MKKRVNYEKVKELALQGKRVKEIAEELGIYYTTVSYILKSFNIKLSKAQFNEHIFDNIDTEEKAYWLGFIYADGCISDNGSLEIRLIDKEHLEKFKEFINSSNPIRIKHYKEYTSYSIMNKSKHLRDILISYGCTPRKSLTLKFPSMSIFQDSSLVIPFVRGVFDGDGSIGIGKHKNCTKPYPRASIVGTQDIVTNCLKCTNIENLVTKYGKNNYYETKFTHSKAIQFLNTIYNNAHIYLDRKYNKYLFAVSLSN